MKIPIRIVGLEPHCRFCEKAIELEDAGWGMANDLITGDFYYYHMECLEFVEDVHLC